MLKNILKGKPKNTSESDLREGVNKNHVCEGWFNTHHFRVSVGSPHRGYEEVMPASKCRFNDNHKDTLGFWENQQKVEEYMHKRIINQTFVESETDNYLRKNPGIKEKNPGMFIEQVLKIERQVPYAPLELSTSCIFAIEFSLERIHDLMEQTEMDLMKTLGTLPAKPSIVGLWPLAHEKFQPILICEWNHGN